jgi:hypothetical protein
MFATSFPPQPEFVAAVRRFVSDFYARVLGDADSSARVALATHELLENAVAYCSAGVVTIRVSVSPFRTRYMVRVRTRNAASREDIEKLRRIVEDISRESDPAHFFRARMRDAARQSANAGLGLSRICAEAAMDITCTTTGDEVEIAAQTLLGSDTNS